ncbi:dihydroorotase [Alicyclobacillus ferrooxydans]|uniref:Dihydroorotase n=1 Tax=Alicyclobacillus ferrooxydans TaxID=471514 RepID=A0A0P9CHY9_9BACL|nr:dihydroorotase [Alicyclobacillus ferrooxydans]KPV45331.1 dihydroorotase [Alicyclobacillus ferrooxydans]
MKRKITGGRLLDLTDGSLTETEILVDEDSGLVVAIGFDLPAADETIELHGEVLLPGFIDLHVHLREPGFEHKETIQSGARAAAAGGFTKIACMPNTNPPLDSAAKVQDVRERAQAAGAAGVFPIACITEGQAGKTLTDYQALKEAGAIALSDDGKGVQDGGLMREAFIRAAEVGLPIAIHAEDESIARDGVFNPGAAAKYGVSVQHGESESAMIARDLLLAEQTGAKLHICHVSVEPAVALIRWAKQRGVRVTAEVTPHHLLLSEDAIERADPVYKVNPPLRSEADRLACLEGFLDGTLDVIATDHAPHSAEEKAKPLSAAPFGIVGIETVFPLLYTYLVETGHISLRDLVLRMSTRPAEAFGLTGGSIRVGGPADITAVDLDTERTIDPEKFYSKGRNTPFAGWQAKGFSQLTLFEGKVIYKNEEVR